MGRGQDSKSCPLLINKKHKTCRKWREEKIHFLAKMSFGRAYACKQTTPFALLANFIRGEATKGSSISLPRKQNKKDRHKTCQVTRARIEDALPLATSRAEPYACKQTTAFGGLANFIRGEATKESSISLPRQKNPVTEKSVTGLLAWERRFELPRRKPGLHP